MRLSRLLAALAIIALIALALFYLDQRGYLKRAVTPDAGYLKVDETPPPAPMDAPYPTPSPVSDASNTAAIAAPGVPVAAITTSTPSGTKIVYLDAHGNPCSPTAVAAAAKPHAPRPASAPRRISPRQYSSASAMPSSPGYTAAACNLMRTGPGGMRSVQLPTGMLINIAVDRDLGTAISAPGQEFAGYLVGPVTYCGQVILPAGAPVYGSVVISQVRPPHTQADAILQLRLTGLDGNGYHFPLQAGSFNRRMPDDPNYTAVAHMNDPNWIENSPVGKDILFPANSVVSFWLQAPATVYF
jgi:hypothetical protein